MGRKGLAIFFICILFISGLVFSLYIYLLYAIGGGPTLFIGTVSESLPTTYSNVELTIDHIYGSASISMAPKNAEYVLLVELDAFRKSRYNLTKVPDIEYTEVNNETIAIIFDDSAYAAADPGLGWNNIRFYISENVNLSLNIVRGCNEGYNITLKNLIISNFEIEFDWSNTVHYASFTNITFNRVSPIRIFTISPTHLIFQDNIFTSHITDWNLALHDTQSQIIFELTQLVPTSYTPVTHNFSISGLSMDILVRLNSSFGVGIETSTTSGTVTLPNNQTTYYSPNYTISEVKYYFFVQTWEGNITFNLDYT